MRYLALTLTLAGAACLCAFPAAAQDDSFGTVEDIWDGKSLDNWDGDMSYWRVEDGVLVGEVTPDKILEQNSWLVWRGGKLKDFELDVEYRISDGGNSGIGYRCEEVEGVENMMTGYQADIEGGDNWTGINYEERGRTFLAFRGMKTLVKPGEFPQIISLFGDAADLQKHVKKNDWNHYRIVARGAHLQHFLNGVLLSEVVDLDGVSGHREGLFGVQVHQGPPMKIELRKIRVRHLPESLQPESPMMRPEGMEPFRPGHGEMHQHLNQAVEAYKQGWEQ